MEASISLRPQYSLKSEDSICNEHVKRIYNKKFHTSESEQKPKTTKCSDMLLDCEHCNDIVGFLENDNYIPQEWEHYKLDDVVNITLFHPNENYGITRFDVEDFFNSIEAPLYYEEDNMITEDEQE